MTVKKIEILSVVLLVTVLSALLVNYKTDTIGKLAICISIDDIDVSYAFGSSKSVANFTIQ